MHEFCFPTTIYFGPGARGKLTELLRDRSLTRPLVVTDRDVARLPIADEVIAPVRAAGAAPALFEGIWGNPVASQVTAGVEAFRAHSADSIVAMGGGAAIDVAKAIALLAGHPGSIFDYSEANPDARPIDRDICPLFTVPTTAGTGSEVGRATVIADDQTKVKQIIFSPRLMPTCALVDPELTLRLPAAVTAATGMDALTHLVEAFCATGYHPMCDGIALEGVRLVATSLTRAVAFARAPSPTAEQLDARGQMLLAALMGAVAFQKGLGANHSLAHALSSVCDLHHGLANGIVLPYVMAFNAASVPDRFARLAGAAGLEVQAADTFVDWLVALKEQIGIPRSLAEVGVRRDQLDLLVTIAVDDPCHARNPRPITRTDVAQLFEAAMAGQ